jgi:hypothetical protein
MVHVEETRGTSSWIAGLSTEDRSTARELEDLLCRLIEQSREAFVEMAGAEDRGALLGAAWTALSPARYTGGLEGDYAITFHGGRSVRYTLSQREGEIVMACHRHLTRVPAGHVIEMDRAAA